MNSAKYFNFRIHKCRESLFYTRVLAAWHKTYAQLQTSGFASHQGLVEILQARGCSCGSVIFLPSSSLASRLTYVMWSVC